jgi:hypothetical protein
VDADLKDYFGSVDHAKLTTLIGKQIADGRVLGQPTLKSFFNSIGPTLPSSAFAQHGSYRGMLPPSAAPQTIRLPPRTLEIRSIRRSCICAVGASGIGPSLISEFDGQP